MTVATNLKRLREEVGEFVARHERAQGVEAFARYRDDPCGFLTDVLRVRNLWSRQREIAELVRDHRQVVVRSANSCGKDFLGARLAIWWAVARGGLAILTGPTDRQVRSVLMKEVGRAFRANADLPGELFTMALRIGDEDKVLAFTASDPDKFTGFHDPETLVIITEGQGVGAEMYEAAMACATSAGSRMLVLGNPLRPSGKFYDICRSENWAAVKIPASEHPNVVHGQEIIPGAVTREWVENIAREYGKDSPQYQARVNASFPEDDVSALFKRAWINAAFDRHAKAINDPQFESIARRIVADIAGGGSDRTCVGTARGDVVERLEFWNEPDLMKVATGLAKLAREYGRWDAARARLSPFEQARAKADVTVDVGGLGLGVADRLSELGVPLTRFNGSNKPNSTKWANRRAAAYWRLRENLERDRAVLPPSEGLAEELLATEWSLDSSGRILICPKDDIRSRIGRSPDEADVVAMVSEHHRTTTVRFW